ncbi:MAG TPA: HEPN domain-containing protein, partial [Isosphaeraceae bacterium]|nr:HEPN domain-containing protein [Isosphaeraceae bacterium]
MPWAAGLIQAAARGFAPITAFLAKSREFLDKAHDLFGAHHWPDEAGRAAYLAGLHAAQALIFEATGQVRKRHPTVQGEFARLVRDDPRFDRDLRAFLPRTYNLKAIADYLTGPGSQVTVEQAQEAIQTVRRFVECVAGLIPANGRTPRAPETE